jgi:hypothetical protein
MSTRYIELYSGRRDRVKYPNPASFEVPFAAVQSNNANSSQSIDPVCNAGIYYTFTLYSRVVPFMYGTYREGSTPYSAYLTFDFFDPGNLIPNFYKGYSFLDDASGESRTIRSFDPTNALLTFDEPFSETLVPGNSYSMYAGYPNRDSVFIPSLDSNGNSISPAELAYNGNTIIFETPNSNYSNPENSNIFFRKISYYDSVNQIAYFDPPLPFDYDGIEQDQTFTLRKIPPNERWTLDTPSYYNATPPSNPDIGPLLGAVIILPEGSSSINNFYRGQFVYFVSNVPQSYTPPLPSRRTLRYPIPGIFYPVYGLFYIKAYNASTRELSLILANANEFNNNIPLPTYGPYEPPNPSAFTLPPLTRFISIENVEGTTYRAIANPDVDWTTVPPKTARMILELEPGTYSFVWTVRLSPNTLVRQDNDAGAVLTYGFTSQWYNTEYITHDYITYTFTRTTAPGIKEVIFDTFILTEAGITEPIYLEWSELTMTRVDTINIITYKYDNANPLDYNGSIVSQSQTPCYSVTLSRLILPNKPLLTGSRIAFYPYVYVEFTDATAPTGASHVINSNNPNSKRALFTIGIPQVSSPDQQAFLTLSEGNTQIIKFKPNDNLRFSVYLPDGTIFTTLVPDSFSPYEPEPSLQINAVFTYTKL